MKRLHLLVIKTFIGPLVLTFFLVIFILLMQFLWKYIDDLVGKGLEFHILAEFLLYASASMVPMALPLAVLLSSLMTFGNLAEHLELLAFKSSGVSLARIMLPVSIVVVGLTLFAFFFANNVMPISNLKMRSLLYDIKRQRPEMQINPGIFDNTMEGYSIRIGGKDSNTDLLRDIWIYDHTANAGNVSVTVADSGYMRISKDEKHLVLTLYNGNTYVEMQKTRKNKGVKSYPHRRDKFSKQVMLIEMVGFGLNRTDENLFRNSYSMMNIDQLTYFEDSLSTDIQKLEQGITTTLTTTTFKKRKTNLKKRKPAAANPSSTPPKTRDTGSPKNSGAGNAEPSGEKETAGNKKQPIAIDSTGQKEEDRTADSITLQDSGKVKQDRSADSSKQGEQTTLTDSTGEKLTDALTDSTAARDTASNIITLHVDSAYQALSPLEKRRAINQAINMARSNKSYITTNASTISYKTKRLRRYQIEKHRKFSLSFACLIFFFIGAPLGAIIRKGGLGMPVIVSVIFFLIYYMISITGEKFVREDLISPFLGMWLSSFILIPMGAFLSYKAANDSVILHIETYFTFFKRFGRYLKKKFTQVK